MNLASFKSEWRRQWETAPPVIRIVWGLVGLLLLPIAYMILNRTFVSIDPESATYFHMAIIERFKSGGQIYVPAGPGYAAPTYAPFYYWASAAVCKFLGSSLVWPRLLSVVCSLVYVGMIGAFIWKRTGSVFLAFVFAALGYGRMPEMPWATEITPNALHSMLAVAGFFVLIKEVTPPRVLASAVLLSLAVLAKQTGLGYVVAAACFVLCRDVKWGLLFVGVAAALLVGVGVWQNAASNGMFLQSAYYFTLNHPWQSNRLWDEVLFRHVLGRFALMTFLSLLPILLMDGRRFFFNLLKAEYVMLGAGFLVTCIAQPKMGSGGQQSLVFDAALLMCGAVGLHRLGEAFAAPARHYILALVVFLQTATLLLPSISNYPLWLIDRHDREHFRQVAEVFKRGRTCYLFFPYLPTTFGQPDSGLYGDEGTMWKNGQLVYDEPDYINEPFRRQEFDFVLVPASVNQRDPTVKAIVENYRAVQKLPGHPRGTFGGEARFETYIFQAHRLLPPDLGPGGG